VAAHPEPPRSARGLTRQLRWIVPAAVLVAAWIAAAVLLWPSKVPGNLHLSEPNPSDVFTATQLDEARDYERFLRINTLLSVVVLLAVLVVYALRGAAFTRESAAGRIGTGMLLGMLGFGIVWLAQLPFGLVALWWDRRHDISKLGYLEWVVNSWFSLGGVFLFVCAAIGIAMALAGRLRERWWIAAVPVFALLGLLFTFVSPFLLTDLQPLGRKQLERKADRYAAIQGISDIPVDVQEVKTFTTAPNAEAAGLGPSRRIILWDTLLSKPFDGREVGFVIAHELGHHSREHLWKAAAWYALFIVPVTVLVALATRRRGGMYEARAIPLALLVTVAAQIALSPAQNVVTRHYEAEADWVALETTRDPKAARGGFVDLATTSLADPKPPTWSYVLNATHPTIVQRIAMADAWAARNDGRPR
jgi:STE24 endopeptidase